MRLTYRVGTAAATPRALTTRFGLPILIPNPVLSPRIVYFAC